MHRDSEDEVFYKGPLEPKPPSVETKGEWVGCPRCSSGKWDGRYCPNCGHIPRVRNVQKPPSK